jgi:hypothetical protein
MLSVVKSCLDPLHTRILPKKEQLFSVPLEHTDKTARSFIRSTGRGLALLAI